jgi:two-component system OmpR family response regulator
VSGNIEPVVLILEDDLEMRTLLLRGLREEGFSVGGVGSGGEALARIDELRPDVLVIDIGLPDADGRDVCQALRANGIATPVLFLTARSRLPDRLAGFSAGGDDYLTKPFAFAELVARLQALLRRAGAPQPVTVGTLHLDPALHAAVADDIVVPLTPTEFRILARLAATPGEAVRRRALIDAAWPHGAIVYDNTLDAYIARLRRKLAMLPEPPTIRTVHGVGYSIE